MKLSLIVPVYNGGRSILKDVKEKLKFLSKYFEEYELIYVLDGRENNSSGSAEKYLEKIKNKTVSFIKRSNNKGKGYSVVEGFHTATGDIIGYMDFGSSIDIEIISRMYNILKSNPEIDAVFPNKYHPQSKFVATLKRKVFSYGYILTTKLLTGLMAPDMQTGVKLYRGTVLKAILPKLLIKRFAFEVEILTALRVNGYNTWEFIPVDLSHVDLSTVKIWDNFRNDVPRMFWDTLAISYRKNIRRWYSKPPVYKRRAPIHSLKNQYE